MAYRLEAPRAQWPYRYGRDGVAEQAIQDHVTLRAYVEATRLLDRLDFLLGNGANITTGDNLWFEFSPIQYSILFEIKAHSKSAGAGNITLRVRVNGTTYDTITIAGGSTAVVVVTPAEQIKLVPTDKISVDCTAVSGNWQYVTLTVVCEPRLLDEV